MSTGDAEPGSSIEAGIRVKDDPDEIPDIEAGGDASSRQSSSSPELTEMKEEPPEEGAGEVEVKEEEEEEDYSEGEMETIEKEVEEPVRHKPGPKSKTRGRSNSEVMPSTSMGVSPVKGTFKVSDIPSHMTQSFVKLSKGEVPPGASPEKSVVVSGSKGKGKTPKGGPAKKPKTPKAPAAPKGGKAKATPKGGKSKGKAAAVESEENDEAETGGRRKSKGKVTYKEDSEEEEMDFNEEEMVDSDEDPGWKPKKKKGGTSSRTARGGNKRKRGAAESDEEDEEEDEEEEEDPDDEEQSDFEEEEMSTKKKKKQPAKKKAKTVSFINLNESRESREPIIEEPTGFQPTVGDYLLEKASVKDGITPIIWLFKKGGIMQKHNKIKNVLRVLSKTPKYVVLNPLFQPTVGDYLLEKASVKDGIAPIIWLFKKGGIMQKHNRVVEDGETLYESAKFFSDWWEDYGDRYALCKVVVQAKTPNKVKVKVTEWPEDMATWDNPVTVNGNEKSQEPTTSDNKENKSPTKTKEASKDPETEVTSTTTQGDENFQIGRFVIDKKDLKNVDNFSIWKIESGILLKKYEMHIVKGKMMHKPVKVYRGYRDIGDFYQSVKIKRVTDLMSDYVEVDEASRPKLTYDESKEAEAENNPLLEHFFVYLQVLLSQALESGFLETVYEKKDPTYMVPINEVEKLVKQKIDQMERALRWTPNVKAALQKCPFLREVHKPVENSICEAIQETNDTVEETVFLFGDDYDKNNLKSEKGAEGSQEFKVGKKAAKNISHYHQLCHFKYNLYDRCKAKIKLLQESKHGAPPVEEIMDACLHNKAWVFQNFTDLLELVEQPVAGE